MLEPATTTETWVGLPVDRLPTPIAVVDLDRLEANIARLAGYAQEHEVALWPHAKTHKMPPVARMQLAAGAAGLTVAKVGEAEVMTSHELGPLLLHYPVYGADAWRRLAEVAAATSLTVAVDSYEAAEPMAAALADAGARAEVLVEIDVGLHRTGVGSPAAACALAQRLDGLDGLDVAGISCFPGHVRGPGRRHRAQARRTSRRCSRRRSTCSTGRAFAATGCRAAARRR